jgi:ribulose 1,5-bisphosphate synthetase/thiazole synthase
MILFSKPNFINIFLILMIQSIDSSSINNGFNITDYCIIGAGPAGIQMAYFLKKSKSDYIIFERNNKAGNNSTT